MFTQILILCCLLGLGSAWTQPNTCYMRQSTSEVEGELRQIREILEESQAANQAIANSLNNLEESQGAIATSLSNLEAIQATHTEIFNAIVGALTQEVTNAPTDSQTIESTDPSTTVTMTTDPSTTVTMTINPSTTATSTTDATPTTPSDTCGGSGWRRVAFINMSDPNQDCPQGLNETDYSIRTCGRSHSGLDNCSPVIFPVSEQYSQVCGRVTAYQFGLNAAFYNYHISARSIDGYYVEGLSLTYGSPRTHIWTFANGLFNGTSGDVGSASRCPCDDGNTFGSPPYVGNDYFCDSIATVDNYNANHHRFYPDDALWDGEGCQGNVNQCCTFNNPPWFIKTLPSHTSDDIEMRMCFFYDVNSANVGIELLEIYVS